LAKAKITLFISLSAFRADDYNLTGSGEPERLHAHNDLAEFFPTLGLNPLAAAISAPKKTARARAPWRSLANGLWKRKFACVAGGSGKKHHAELQSYTIVGVAQARIPGISPSDVYVPIGQWTDPTFLDRRIDGQRIRSAA